MRHRYECPLRWADLDLLGHVNNVVYVDYLQEARVDLLRVHAPAAHTGELAEGVVVVRHQVHYRAPLTLARRTVSIDCWVTEVRAASFTMAYELYHDDPQAPGGRRVYLQATTLLTPYVFTTERPRRLTPEEQDMLRGFLEETPRPPRVTWTTPHRTEAGHYPVQVRFSDVDVYGHVNNVKYFEYFMEGRILLVSRLCPDLGDSGQDTPATVVAQMDVDYLVPILFRREAYDLWSWIVEVGERSFVVESQICDGETVLSRARVAMVFFDRVTQRSTQPPDQWRLGLQQAQESALRDALPHARGAAPG